MTRVQQRYAAMLAALALALGFAFLALQPQAAHAVEYRVTAGSSPTAATNLPLTGKNLSSTNYATFNTTNDNNFYKFKTSNRNSTYKITLKTDSDDGSIHFMVFDSSMRPFYSGDLPTTKKRVVRLQKLKRNQIYYIWTWRYATDSPLYTSDVPYADYRLTVKEVVTPPAKVQNFKAVSNAKYKIKVSYSRSFYADGYQVKYVRTWKKGTKDKNFYRKTTKTTFTFPTKYHGAAKKYKVKVRPYRTVNGKTYYGKWSKSITLKVK